MQFRSLAFLTAPLKMSAVLVSNDLHFLLKLSKAARSFRGVGLKVGLLAYLGSILT